MKKSELTSIVHYRIGKKGIPYFVICSVCIWNLDTLKLLGYEDSVINGIKEDVNIKPIVGNIPDPISVLCEVNEKSFRVGIEITRLTNQITLPIESYTDIYGYSGISTWQDAPY